MPRDVNGTYTLPTNDSSPAAPRNVIRSSDFNELTGDYATALTDSFSRSGKGAALADLDMGGFDLLNPGNLPTNARTLNAGTGLTGGGDLSADRTIALNAASIASLAKADTAIQPTATSSIVPSGTLNLGSAANQWSNIFVGTANVGSDTVAGVHLVNGPAASNRLLRFRTAGTNRALIGVDNVAESGSSAGSNFILQVSTDAGVASTVLSFARATGKGTFTIKPQVGASDVLIVSDTGRAVGKVAIYEDFGGFPTLNTDSRIILRKATATNADVYNVAVLRTAASGGTAGFVNSALRVETTVDSVTATFEWALLAKLNVNAAGGGEHCALYSQAVKTADGSAWAHCVEARDTVVNPTTGTLGIELGMFIQGGDSSGMRHALDISIGSADSLAGTNIVTTAIRIGPTTGDATRAQLVNGMQIKGRVGTGIDLSLLDVSYSTTTFRMPTNGIISWRDNNQTLRGEIGWNATINTWQLTGMLNATSATAGGATALPATPQGYMHFQLNGTMRKVPYYAV